LAFFLFPSINFKSHRMESISCTEKLDSLQIYPNEATADDHDIYTVLVSTIRQCAPATLHFLHIQGHQDTKANCPLTIVEQFNVDCDHKAKTFVLTTMHSSTAYGNPDIKEARPHIKIHGKLICRKLLPTLRQALAAPEYNSYLKKKLNWTNTDLKDINWPVLKGSLDSFNPNDQRRIILFINDKLPLRTSKAHPHMGSSLCPSCQREDEDNWHFLECTQADRSALFNALRGTLTTTTQKLRLHPCFHTALWLGLSSIRHHTPYPDISHELPVPLRDSVEKQTRLGWDQLYQG